MVDCLENGVLFVWGGDGFGVFVGELYEENGGLWLICVVVESMYCSGCVVVLNVYGKLFDVVCKILIVYGW